MKPEEEKKKEEEIEKIYQKIFEVIPTEVAMVNIIIALNRLSIDFTYELTDDDELENGDDKLLPDTSFSVN